LSLQNLDVELALSILNNAAELAGRQLGQVLGKSGGATTIVGQLLDGSKCTSPAMYGLAIPYMTIGLSSIQTPVFSMTPQDVG
jgi:hypothetical protein